MRSNTQDTIQRKAEISTGTQFTPRERATDPAGHVLKRVHAATLAPKAETSRVEKTATATTAKTPNDATLGTQKDIFSYALGMNIGEGLQRQSVEVTPDLFVRGLALPLESVSHDWYQFKP